MCAMGAGGHALHVVPYVALHGAGRAGGDALRASLYAWRLRRVGPLFGVSQFFVVAVLHLRSVTEELTDLVAS